MNELLKRTLAALVMIAIALFATWKGGWWFTGLAAIAAAVLTSEWLRITRGWAWWWAPLGLLYAILPAFALVAIRADLNYGLELILWVFIVTWATDIGAYFAGRTIGGPKLAPTISPNKTVAGLIGGMVAAELFAGLFVYLFAMPTILYWVAAPFAFAAQMGDLFESHLKRKAGVKDSGTFIPGHGGAMDRLDGLVVVAVLTGFLLAMGWV